MYISSEKEIVWDPGSNSLTPFGYSGFVTKPILLDEISTLIPSFTK